MESSKEKLSTFFKNHNFSLFSSTELTKDILSDMEIGLGKNSEKASQKMIVAASSVPHDIGSESVIIIDAGGTNFRSCLAKRNADGKIEISDFEKVSMPATKEELSKDEFYDAIAANLEHLKNKSDRIGFCFSYAMEILEDGDGKVLVFSKEIKAPGVIGTQIGKELKTALYRRGWNEIKKITLLNDTTACLLSGLVSKNDDSDAFNQNYDSYVGFILGTGMNNAYIEYNPIPKKNDGSTEHIIVCECGMFNNIEQSDFDKMLDETSINKNQSVLEKMCSGAYLGNLIFQILKCAFAEKFFSSDFCNAFSNVKEISTPDIDDYFSFPDDSSKVFSRLLLHGNDEDKTLLVDILNITIKRAAIISASVIAASILKSGKGTKKEKPVCVVCNGTTFWKTHGLEKSVKEELSKLLTDGRESWKRFYRIKKIDNEITIGTYAAAFM